MSSPRPAPILVSSGGPGDSVLAAASRKLAQAGHQVLTAGPSLRTLPLTSETSGVLIGAVEPLDRRADLVRAADLPWASFGHSARGNRKHVIDIDMRAVGARAIDHFAALGCNRISVLPPPLTSVHGQELMAGIGAQARVSGLHVDIVPGPACYASAECQLPHLARSLRMRPRTDGLLCASATAALAALGACAQTEARPTIVSLECSELVHAIAPHVHRLDAIDPEALGAALATRLHPRKVRAA